MGKYLHRFDAEEDFNEAYNGEDYIEPWVSYTDETEGEEHVDYNRTTGNKVVINAICDQTQDYWYESIGYEVEYASSDFVPFSSGATYEFRCPWGNETFVVGQTYEYDEYTNPIEFDGHFSVSYDGLDPLVPTYIHMVPRGSCAVRKNIDGTVEVYCELE